jgi:hypothetical protein
MFELDLTDVELFGRKVIAFLLPDLGLSLRVGEVRREVMVARTHVFLLQPILHLILPLLNTGERVGKHSFRA